MRRFVFPILLGCLAAGGAELRVGAAKTVLTPDLERHGPVYLAGFGHNRRATGVHDDLYARCMAFSTGARPLVLCGVDSIGLFLDDVRKIRAHLDADLVVSATHNHETPDTMGLWGPASGQSGILEAYNQFVVDRVTEAARGALSNLRPARIRLANVTSPELEAFIHDTRPPVRTDAGLTVLVAETPKHEPIGTLVNWSNHPEALDSRNTLVTADYLAYLHPVLEGKLGGVSVFCNGAVGGMQSPLGARVVDPATGQPVDSGSFRFAELIGSRVGAMAAAAAAGATPFQIDSIVFRETLVRIAMTNPGFQMAVKAGVFGGRKQPEADGTSATPVGYVRFSGAGRPVLEIALIPGELYPELSLGGIERYAGADFPDAPEEPAIKLAMSARFRMLFGLADDEIGYIIPKAEWDAAAPWLQNAPKRWYGEINSMGPDAAPAIAKAFQDLVHAEK